MGVDYYKQRLLSQEAQKTTIGQHVLEMIAGETDMEKDARFDTDLCGDKGVEEKRRRPK